MIVKSREELEKTPGRRIAFYGGTFDPFHPGHVRVMEAALADHVDHVVVCPHSHSPSKSPAPINDRIQVAALVLEDSRFRASVSISSPGLIHGLQNDRFLKIASGILETGREVWILAGRDSVGSGYFPELGKLPHLVHLRDRTGMPADGTLQGPVVTIPCRSTLSSSSIREALSQGGRHPSEPAHTYITAKGLYGKHRSE